MKGLIDYDDEEFIRRTRALIGFLDDLQNRMAPRTPTGAATGQKKVQDEPVPPTSETAGRGHPFEVES